MKRIYTLLLFVVMGFATKVSASTSEYTVNDQAIESMIASAQVSLDVTADVAGITNASGATVKSGDKNAWIAFVLCYFLGGLGIHRFYMGTAVATGIGYILTAGGCGIVATVDCIVLFLGAINNDIDKYVDNTKFFMW